MINDNRIDELFSTITDPTYINNINKEAFSDIANVLLSFHDLQYNSNYKLVCNAAPGHGKTTVLIAYLKWITQQRYKQPILLAVREKQLAYKIYEEVSKVSTDSIINIDSDNKTSLQSDLVSYQIVIIQHQRLKDMALGFGDIDTYSNYKINKSAFGKPHIGKVHRKLIIDEKPEFADSVIFDITSKNNILDWFEDLAKPLPLTTGQIQNYKFYIMLLMGEQTTVNLTDHTTSLLSAEDVNSIRTKNLLSVLEEMENNKENITKYESLNKLKHFKKLLHEDNYGRIDDYTYNASGRKIIISKLINYSILGMPLLTFDGTAGVTGIEYMKLGYKWASMDNRNDYSRLHIHIDKINTSKYSRDKDGNPIQKTIARRIRQLRMAHDKLFVLPMKDEIEIYISELAIKDSDKYLYYDDKVNHTKGANLLNTTGKNYIKDYNALYLTCLPKKNADYYKCIGLAIWGDDIKNLVTNSDSGSGVWFDDSKLQNIYEIELYAEILQIIHRSALRKINEDRQIHIYIATNEDEERRNYDGFVIVPFTEKINTYFLGEEASIDHYTLTDMSLYGRDKKINDYAKQIKNELVKSNLKELTVGKISSSFSNYIKKHWTKQNEYIKNEFICHGIDIYVDESDKRKTKKVKLI